MDDLLDLSEDWRAFLPMSEPADETENQCRNCVGSVEPVFKLSARFVWVRSYDEERDTPYADSIDGYIYLCGDCINYTLTSHCKSAALLFNYDDDYFDFDLSTHMPILGEDIPVILVPKGWSREALLEEIKNKDRRIQALEEENQRLRDEIDCAPPGGEGGRLYLAAKADFERQQHRCQEQ